MTVTLHIKATLGGRVEFAIVDEHRLELGWFNIPEETVTASYLKELALDTLDEPDRVEEVYLSRAIQRLLKTRWKNNEEVHL